MSTNNIILQVKLNDQEHDFGTFPRYIYATRNANSKLHSNNLEEQLILEAPSINFNLNNKKYKSYINLSDKDFQSYNGNMLNSYYVVNQNILSSRFTHDIKDTFIKLPEDYFDLTGNNKKIILNSLDNYSYDSANKKLTLNLMTETNKVTLYFNTTKIADKISRTVINNKNQQTIEQDKIISYI